MWTEWKTTGQKSVAARIVQQRRAKGQTKRDKEGILNDGSRTKFQTKETDRHHAIWTAASR